jgi:ABC-2 type transport system ATP-binding protein
VRKLNEQGMTIVLTTHYLEEAEEMCDEIAIINHGQVVARDTTAHLLGSIDQKTMIIESDTPIAAFDVPNGIELSVDPRGALRLTYRASKTSADAVLEAVRNAGVTIRDVRTEQADLEDVFLELTRSR